MMRGPLFHASGFTSHKREVFSGMALNLSLTASLTSGELSLCKAERQRHIFVGLRFLMEQGHSFFFNPFLGSHLEVVFSFSLRHLTLGLPENPEGTTANDFILPHQRLSG